MSSYYFREQQKVRQIWIYFLILAVFGVWMWQLVQQVFMGIPFGTDPAPDWAVWVIGIIPVAAFVLLFTLKLETQVDQEGVRYRMWPIIKKYRLIRADEIIRWEVGKYNPIRDYGGWGIRTGWGKRGMAYNISGNQGASFELKNGKRILIGTRMPEEMRSALGKMNK